MPFFIEHFQSLNIDPSYSQVACIDMRWTIKLKIEDVAVPEICREFGISSATVYRRRSKFGGVEASKMNLMKELEAENVRLKKNYAEGRLKAKILQEAITKRR